jgi:parallel beta-helix repeat protein
MDVRARRSAWFATLIPLPLVAGLVLAGAGPAVASEADVSCGSVLTRDTTLQADLLDCPGNGLVIGADGITVDLNGHTISGRIISTGGGPDQVGIDNSAGHDDVTIRNGTIDEFARGGVHLVGADRNRVSNLSMFLDGDFGILVETGSGNRITDNALRAPRDIGIGVFGTSTPSRNNVISGNSIEQAEVADIALRYGRIADTLIEGNTTGVHLGISWGAAIAVSARYVSDEGDIRGTVVRRNHLSENYSGGVFVGNSASGTVVDSNQMDDIYGLPAIEVESSGTLVRRNVIRSPAFSGSTDVGVKVDEGAERVRVDLNSIDRAFLDGIDDSGTGTLISANLVQGESFDSGEPPTGVGAGIIVREEGRGARLTGNVVRRQAGSSFDDGRGGIVVLGDDVRLVGNVVTDVLYSDGIAVLPQAQGTRLTANIATRSRADDGIDVADPSAVLRANVANDNHDLGIEAVPGVTDAGGNTAAGNGNPLECVGVTCR